MSCDNVGLAVWEVLLSQEDPLEKKMQPTPVFLPGNSHGQRSLVGYSQWGHKRVAHNLAIKPNIVSGD